MLTTPSSDILCLRRFTFSAGQYNAPTNDGQSSTANFCPWLASSQVCLHRHRCTWPKSCYFWHSWGFQAPFCLCHSENEANRDGWVNMIHRLCMQPSLASNHLFLTEILHAVSLKPLLLKLRKLPGSYTTWHCRDLGLSQDYTTTTTTTFWKTELWCVIISGVLCAIIIIFFSSVIFVSVIDGAMFACFCLFVGGGGGWRKGGRWAG